MNNLRGYFVIFKANGEIRMRGEVGSIDFILANTKEGDTYHWMDDVARTANGVVEPTEGDDIEFSIV